MSEKNGNPVPSIEELKALEILIKNSFCTSLNIHLVNQLLIKLQNGVETDNECPINLFEPSRFDIKSFKAFGEKKEEDDYLG